MRVYMRYASMNNRIRHTLTALCVRKALAGCDRMKGKLLRQIACIYPSLVGDMQLNFQGD